MNDFSLTPIKTFFEAENCSNESQFIELLKIDNIDTI